MPRKIIHSGGMFSPSSGPKRTDCGLLLPCDSNHFAFIGTDEPRGSRRCKRCAKAKRLKYWKWAVQQDINKRISQGLRLAWARRKAAAQ